MRLLGPRVHLPPGLLPSNDVTLRYGKSQQESVQICSFRFWLSDACPVDANLHRSGRILYRNPDCTGRCAKLNS
jgi:hypothetical protein